MKSNKLTIFVALFVLLLLSACGSIPSENIEPTATIVAFSEKSDPSNNPEVNDPEDIDSAADDEKPAIGNGPQSGNWLWVNSEPVYDNCPGDFSQITNPSDPPVEVTIYVNPGGELMQIESDGTVIELQREDVSESASSYYGEVFITMPEGEELRVEYFLDYNLSGNGEITGTLVSWLPAFDGCTATREFTADFLGVE